MQRKRNLLLAFDAFGTLFHPKRPIQEQYGEFAAHHGLKQNQWVRTEYIKRSFGKAFKEESEKHPNYGRATNLGAENWWANIITKTFEPFLEPGQKVPQELVSDLLRQFSTDKGYSLYPDVIPFFQMLRQQKTSASRGSLWKWDRTIVGVVTNSDSRVPDILQSFGLKVGNRRFGSEIPATIDNESDDINFVVLSYDVGHEKPDRRIFDAALETLQQTLVKEGHGAHAEDYEKLYIGDDHEKDYLGALDAGWKAIRLKRGSTVADSATICNLSALYEWEPDH